MNCLEERILKDGVVKEGSVLKVDSLAQREELGVTTKVPKWAVAYKYPPEKKETILKDCLNNPSNYLKYQGIVEDILEDEGLPNIRMLKMKTNK